MFQPQETFHINDLSSPWSFHNIWAFESPIPFGSSPLLSWSRSMRTCVTLQQWGSWICLSPSLGVLMWNVTLPSLFPFLIMLNVNLDSNTSSWQIHLSSQMIWSSLELNSLPLHVQESSQLHSFLQPHLGILQCLVYHLHGVHSNCLCDIINHKGSRFLLMQC